MTDLADLAAILAHVIQWRVAAAYLLGSTAILLSVMLIDRHHNRKQARP